jgi:hypothetical protein
MVQPHVVYPYILSQILAERSKRGDLARLSSLWTERSAFHSTKAVCTSFQAHKIFVASSANITAMISCALGINSISMIVLVVNRDCGALVNCRGSKSRYRAEGGARERNLV